MLREKSLYLIYKGNIIGITCKACLIKNMFYGSKFVNRSDNKRVSQERKGRLLWENILEQMVSVVRRM